jgi:hypothetical protein
MEKPEEWKKKGGMEEARAAAPGPSPWQPAGVRRLPESRFREEKRGEAGRSWSRWGCRSWRSPRSPPRWTAASPPACRRSCWTGERSCRGCRAGAGQVAPSPSRTACFLFTELFAASPGRQGAGLLHKGDADLEAMDRAALLLLLQAVPLLSTAPSSLSCPEREVRNPLHLVVDPAIEPRLDRAM